MGRGEDPSASPLPRPISSPFAHAIAAHALLVSLHDAFSVSPQNVFLASPQIAFLVSSQDALRDCLPRSRPRIRNSLSQIFHLLHCLLALLRAFGS